MRRINYLRILFVISTMLFAGCLLGVVLQIKLCSILQIIRSRFLLCYVNGNRLFGVDSALCFI